MTDLMRADGEVRYQQHTFSEQRPRQKLINKCVDLINEYTIATVSCGVNAEAYRRIISKEAQKKIGKDSHVFVFRMVMKSIVDMLSSINWPYPTALIFDDNREYGIECYGHYSKSRESNPEWKKTFASIAFSDDDMYPPIQAADMLAWFLRKSHGKAYDGSFDRTIKRLVKNKDSVSRYYNEAALVELDKQLNPQ